MASKPEKIELDWDEAVEHLMEVEQRYLSLMGVPGVNVMFFFTVVLPPIRGAYNNKIRTKNLHDRIMSLQ